MTLSHEDVWLVIDGTPAAYTIEAQGIGQRPTSAPFRWEPPPTIQALLVRRAQGEALQLSESEAVRSLLARALFPRPIRELLQRTETPPLRLKLVVRPPALVALPWELLAEAEEVLPQVRFMEIILPGSARSVPARAGSGPDEPRVTPLLLAPHQVTQALVKGLDRLPTDYGTRVQHFLLEYLGTATEPVPFGGRDRELAALDAWLAEPAAPPYLLLAAEAGRGKSALLVAWAQRLVARGEVAAIFVPVSIRFNTALASVFFTTLAARLGDVYGEPVPWATLSAEAWREICQSFLARTPPDGKRVVIILSGLDEAASWQLGTAFFPHQPVPGVRVVVSARFQVGEDDARGWLRRLGWEQGAHARSMGIERLDRAGLSQALMAMGNPLEPLATKGNVTGELYRLSEGDPLLVRLYVEVLQPQGETRASLHPEALAQIRPGLAGYFDHWWAAQRLHWGKETARQEPAVRTLLALLAGALGPLDQETLLWLAPAGSGLDRTTLADALASLAHLVVGDGTAQGYIFSHPRLGYHVWRTLAPEAQRAWQACFLALGHETLTALSQHGVVLRDQPWHHHPQVRLPIRSTSVVDVLELPSGERLIVAMLGFKPWPPETPETLAHHLAEAQATLHALQRTSLGEAQRQLLH